jgi:multimeric flavodoxin WrbA
MVKSKGNTKIILQKVEEVQNSIGAATSYIDTKDQHKIRAELERALRLCIEIRDMYDPI